MASFPGSKVHRPSRRKLGRGQSVQVPSVLAAATAATTLVTITFPVPVVVNGIVPLVVNGGPEFVSQTVVSQTVVHQTFDTSCAGKTWHIAGGGPEVRSYEGGVLAAASGTF